MRNNVQCIGHVCCNTLSSEFLRCVFSVFVCFLYFTLSSVYFPSVFTMEILNVYSEVEKAFVENLGEILLHRRN